MLRPSRLSMALVVAALHTSVALAAPAELASALVQVSGSAESVRYDAVVEAVRQTVIAAQVSGAVIELPVKAGDVVKAGQVLVRIDARSAVQGSLASQAQTQAARSALELATKDVERQRHLYEKQYISQSAMERAEAQYRATSEQLKAQIAQASIANIQSDFFVIRAPYSGVIAELPIALGDMAMPGKPMLTVYDPKGLRVTASVPQTTMSNYLADQPFKIEFPGMPAGHQWLSMTHMQILPTIDAGTHTLQVRVDLPATAQGIAPGLFARIWLPSQSASGTHVYVPGSAIVRRAEMTGLYVIDSNKRPVLRQVRLGSAQNDTIEVLAGVSAGERIALDPAAAVKEVR